MPSFPAYFNQLLPDLISQMFCLCPCLILRSDGPLFMHINTVYKHESCPAVFELQALPLVIDKERQPCRWYVNTARSILHAQARSGLFCMVWGRRLRSAETPFHWSLLSSVTIFFPIPSHGQTLGPTGLLRKLTVAAREETHHFGSVSFFPIDPQGHGSPGVLELESVFRQAPTLWDKSEALLASLFKSRKYVSTFECGNVYKSVFIMLRWINSVVQWFTGPQRHRFKLPFCYLLSGCPLVLYIISLIPNLLIWQMDLRVVPFWKACFRTK